MPSKYEYLLKAYAIMVNGDLTLSGCVEASRFMVPLRYLHSKLTLEEMWGLAVEGRFT